MTSSVSTPYSYLGQLQGVYSGTTTPAVSTSSASGSASESSSASAGSSANATNQAAVSALLSNSSAFTPEVLSLLQENSSSGFDPVSSLLGGASTDNSFTTLLSNLYTTAAQASETQAKDSAVTAGVTTTSSGSGASASPVQLLINAQTQASIAYNQTNLQNIQNIVNNDSYQADGSTPLTT